MTESPDHDLPVLPRTNNDRESEFRDLKRRLLSTTGQKGATRRILQRQWSDLAIARTTPALSGLFSWVTLAAHVLQTESPIPVRSAAWYTKSLPTFSDAIALLRQHLWPCSQTFCMSSCDIDVIKVPKSLFLRLVDTLCYAA